MTKQNIPQDAAWKTVQYTKNNLFCSSTFGFLNEQNSETLIFEISKKNDIFRSFENYPHEILPISKTQETTRESAAVCKL